MSRIGKAIINIPDSVKVSCNDQLITVEGSKGKSSYIIPEFLSYDLQDKTLAFKCESGEKVHIAIFGTTRMLVNNMIVGVNQGWSKNLEIVGVGYRIELKGKEYHFLLGFSHPIVMTPPKGIEFKLEGNTKLSISGIDKQQVGQIAANIRSLRPPDAYKGKGVRYSNEHIRKKEVKKS